MGLGDDFVQRGDDGFDGGGLLEVFVRAHVEGQLLVARRGVGGGVDDDGQVAQARVLADFVAEPVAVHPRHEDVGDDHVHALTLQQSERVHAVMGLEDRVAFGLELGAEQLQVGGMVVNDEEVHGAFAWSSMTRIFLRFSVIAVRCPAGNPATWSGSLRVSMGLVM